MKKIIVFFLAGLLLLSLCACGPVQPVAEPEPASTATPEPTATPTPTATPKPTPEPTPVPPAEERTEGLTVTSAEGSSTVRMTDGNRMSCWRSRGGSTLHIEAEEPICSLYLEWDTPPEPYTVTWGESSLTGGENEFLHEYLPFGEEVTSLDIAFSGAAECCAVRAFGPGTLPADLQVWQTPWDTADVLVLSAHSDDDVIFFGGVIADSVDRDLAVQVCYLVNHDNWPPRPHELLDALWCMGVRHYPVIGPFPDHYVLSLDDALQSFGEEAVISYEVDLLRRFQPQVVVTHDREGEYGHGAHRICAMTMEQAVLLAADPEYSPETEELYGVWNTPKLYLHQAEEEPIVLDVDRPLESFGGETAFEVAWDAMMYHQSQLQYAHRPQKESEEFPRYDCRKFGLVRSTVGQDTGGDIMENVEPHGEP